MMVCLCYFYVVVYVFVSGVVRVIARVCGLCAVACVCVFVSAWFFVLLCVLACACVLRAVV